MDPVLVVGGGIAGIAAALEVQRAGRAVVACDRGRRLGGRMASRSTEGRPVDIGASYFTVSDPAFSAVADDWQRRGLAREWTDTLTVYGDPEKSSTSGPMRWAAPRGLRSLVEDLAAGLDVRSSVAVERIDPDLVMAGQTYAAVALAMPDPQARRLLDPGYADALAALDDPYEPVLALTAGWADRTWAELDGGFVHGDPVLAWVADDGRRRGDDAPVLVAHSTADFAAAHLEEPDAAQPAMVDALLERLEIPAAPAYASVHRWSFARPTKQRDDPYFLGDDGLGVCGDGWHGKSRVEGAYLSGRALGRAIAERLS
ncbi:MAG TPA: FAD-dependent oxidoreductase [Propionibacteriaceae bacterium]|nr:FAD-dependent oxidoreductase [Propionibacteriaceae bacterium]